MNTVAVITLAALVICWKSAVSQQTNPLNGNPGAAIPGSRIDISVSALLQRAISLDTTNSKYDAVWWVVLSWQDPTAGDEVLARTGSVASTPCARGCDSNGLLSSGCCDSIWLPSVELPNLVAYDQVRTRVG